MFSKIFSASNAVISGFKVGNNTSLADHLLEGEYQNCPIIQVFGKVSLNIFHI
jgi:hypothetical protein